MKTDPTTRDPAAILPCPFCGGAPVFEPYKRDGLTLKCANFGCPASHGYNQRTRYNSTDWLRATMTETWNRRDAAPALLAEVERLRAELAGSQEWQVVFEAQAEAAEQVARECGSTLARAVQLLDASACPNRCEDGECSLCVETQTFLAHHGARTGDSNDGR